MRQSRLWLDRSWTWRPPVGDRKRYLAARSRCGPAGCSRTAVCRADRLGGGEVSIGAVRNHRLTRLKMELNAIEMYRDDVRLERHQVGDARDLGIGIRIRPCRQTCVVDGVVAAEPFVWAEGLAIHGSEGGLIDVCAWNVPTRREAGLVEDERPRGIGDDAVMMADHEVTGGLANVDAVVVVGGMAHDSFVFLVESVHGPPGEREVSLQFARV